MDRAEVPVVRDEFADRLAAEICEHCGETCDDGAAHCLQLRRRCPDVAGDDQDPKPAAF